MYDLDDLGQPGEPDYWEPKTKTERKILESMKEERELRPLIFQWMGSTPTPMSNEVKDIRIAHQNYHNFRRSGYTSDSDLDLEMLLEKVRLSIMCFEDKAEEPGKYQEFYRGIMDANHGFLWYIICLREAKRELKRELENGA
jgi:hypothetical protein